MASTTSRKTGAGARDQKGRTLCGRLGQALRSGAYVGFREGQPTLVNIAEVSD